MDNIADYLSLSSRIAKLYREHKITLQTLSDIIRCNLLYKYGGVWCDATLLFFKRYEFKEDIAKYGFISINDGESTVKRSLFGEEAGVTHTSYFMGTYKSNNVMHAMVDFFNEYYEKNEYAIDYFMTDLALILCKRNKICNSQLDNIPLAEGSPYYLSDQLLNDRPVNISKCLGTPQKLNWRNEEIATKLKELDLESKN